MPISTKATNRGLTSLEPKDENSQSHTSVSTVQILAADYEAIKASMVRMEAEIIKLRAIGLTTLRTTTRATPTATTTSTSSTITTGLPTTMPDPNPCFPDKSIV